MGTAAAVGAKAVFGPAGLDDLIAALRARGYTVVGPAVREDAIALGDLRSAADLPVGLTDEQDAGRYRVHQRPDGAFFGYASGPQPWKQLLFPPRVRLTHARRTDQGWVPGEADDEAPRYALVGARACDLAAIAVQDRILAHGPHPDPAYVARRSRIFVVSVQCTEPGGTCFCVSTGTGPSASAGFDLALTELLEGDHRFLVEVGSERGAELLDEVPHLPAPSEDESTAEAAVEAARGRMGRAMDVVGLPGILAGAAEHPRWAEVAERCLTCGNCTMVCPTCFCSAVEDVVDLRGEHAERWRRWDSCFTGDFSYLHGGTVRTSTMSRYRQWLTHKLGTWHDQFGTSGCVGCGRCVTWCPVGIDLTEEVAALREEA